MADDGQPLRGGARRRAPVDPRVRAPGKGLTRKLDHLQRPSWSTPWAFPVDRCRRALGRRCENGHRKPPSPSWCRLTGARGWGRFGEDLRVRSPRRAFPPEKGKGEMPGIPVTQPGRTLFSSTMTLSRVRLVRLRGPVCRISQRVSLPTKTYRHDPSLHEDRLGISRT